MHAIRVFAVFALLVLVAFAQGDRGTITGTVADPVGAVVPNAPIEARNIETGAVYQTASTSTGNFTIAQLPGGMYELSVAVSGFKRYVRPGLEVQLAQTIRVDVTLEVGSAAESITVNESAPLLKTESGEISHNIAGQRIDELPVGSLGAIRNPLSVSQLVRSGADHANRWSAPLLKRNAEAVLECEGADH